MVKDHSDNEKGNLQHGLIFPIRERDVAPGRPSTHSATWCCFSFQPVLHDYVTKAVVCAILSVA